MIESPVAYAVEYRAASAPIVLGLDASSVTLGWCLIEGQAVLDFGTFALQHDDINERCRLARADIGGLLRVHPDIDVSAIETPVLKRYRKGTNIAALIKQCFVQGAIRSELAKCGIFVVDVAPGQGKRRLTGFGDAGKEEMQRAALCYGVVGEHAADALGVALFGLGRVEVTRP